MRCSPALHPRTSKCSTARHLANAPRLWQGPQAPLRRLTPHWHMRAHLCCWGVPGVATPARACPC
jgi:hypothetical protein